MSQDDNANPDLDPVKIRADIYPHVQAATGTQDRQGRIYGIGLVSSLLCYSPSSLTVISGR